MRWSPLGHRIAYAMGMALAVSGCGQPKIQPTIMEMPTPSEAAGAAFKTYDQNADGSLSADEVAGSPGLRSVVKVIDADGNGSISVKELEDRIDQIVARDVRFAVLPCRIEVDGQPLPNAEVKFEPEAFFGAMNKPATATTGPDGRTFPRTEGEPVPGIYPGYYRVRVSRKDSQGRETLPAKLNADSQVGVEVGLKDADYYEDAELVLKLKSK